MTCFAARVCKSVNESAQGPCLCVCARRVLRKQARLCSCTCAHMLSGRCPLLLRAGAMFGSVVEVALAVPREFPGHKLLRARFISFVHRMVEGLQVCTNTYVRTHAHLCTHNTQTYARTVLLCCVPSVPLCCMLPRAVARAVCALLHALPVQAPVSHSVLALCMLEAWNNQAFRRQKL